MHYEQADFIKELQEYVADIIMGDFTGVDAAGVLELLYTQGHTDPKSIHDDQIQAAIKELGGKACDPDDNKEFKEPKENEGDY